MATVSKKQIGIDARRQTKEGRFYEIVPGDPFPSVTTILQIVNKPALVPWAAKEERIMCMAAAADLFFDGGFAPDSREVFLSALEAHIGREKAHRKLMTSAGEIGTEIHGKCEWHVRKMMGQTVGAEPKLSVAAQPGYDEFLKWAAQINLGPVRSEHVVHSLTHRYAGTYDLLAWIDTPHGRRLALIDFKSGKAIYSESYMQIASYWHALTEMGLETADIGMVLRLPKLGTDPGFEPVEVPDLPGNFKGFLYAQGLWLWQQDREHEYKARVEAMKQLS